MEHTYLIQVNRQEGTIVETCDGYKSYSYRLDDQIELNDMLGNVVVGYSERGKTVTIETIK